MSDLAPLLDAATGADAAIDKALAECFGLSLKTYSGDVEDARALVAAILPGWNLHLGYDVLGVFPYAALTKGAVHLEAEAAALPLAILRVAVKAAALPVPEPSEALSAPPEA